MAQGPVPISTTISGPTPWIDVKAYGAKGDGATDDTTAIQNAINACPTNGCTIYFGAGSTYFISTGLTISPAGSHPTQGIRLLGECGAPGTHDVAGIGETCSHLVTSTGPISAFVMLTVGVTGVGTPALRGLVIQDLGFQDQSSNRAVSGAIRLNKNESFNLTNIHCRGMSSGYCFLFDGGSSTDFTQFGVVINPSTGNVKFPIQTNNQTSEINLYGGNLDCADISGSIAMDLGKTNGVAGVSTGGEWGVFGTHILNCDTGVSMFNNGNMNYYGIMEQTNSTHGDGILIDGDITDKPTKSILAGSINRFNRGVILQGTAGNTRVLANISNTNTPLVTTAGSLPSTLILTAVNYSVGSGGTAIGTQFPDITIPGESKPSPPASGSRRLYVDAGTGNGSDLTVERPDGTVVDLEGGLLSYQKATGTITGNGSNQTVYSFSVPPIPAGKGIRARVFWQCTTCSTGSKTFSWQFGGSLGTTAAYTAYSSNSSALTYTEVRIFNHPGSQATQTMFGDAITLGTSLVSAGTFSSPSRNTSTAQTLSFLFNAPNTETITPQGFILEASQ